MAKKFKNYKKEWKEDDEVTLKKGAEWTRRVGVDFPDWMIKSLDQEANRIGITRQALIKTWISQKLDQMNQKEAV